MSPIDREVVDGDEIEDSDKSAFDPFLRIPIFSLDFILWIGIVNASEYLFIKYDDAIRNTLKRYNSVFIVLLLPVVNLSTNLDLESNVHFSKINTYLF